MRLSPIYKFSPEAERILSGITEKDVYGQEPVFGPPEPQRVFKRTIEDVVWYTRDFSAKWRVRPKPGFQYSPDFKDIVKIQTP